MSSGEGKQRRRPARLPIAIDPAERLTLDEVSRAHTLVVLAACHGNRTNAARVLGVDRKTLARNIVRWGITMHPESRALTPGSLVAIEGLDGSGITTQAEKLVAYLDARGHRAMLTREPSAGRIGTFTRELLADKTALAHAGALRTLSLLFAADRIDHLHSVVTPALARGITVVSDRWYHSSLAYQRTGVERDWIAALHRPVPTPDVTVFLDVRPEVASERREAAQRPREFFHEPATQLEVAAGYRATIAELRTQGERIEVVDGERSIDDVFKQLLRAVGLAGRRAK